MRRAILALTAVGTMAAAGSALGQSENAAVVEINDTGCFVLNVDATDAIMIPVPALGGDGVVQSLLTSGGNAKLTCNGTLPEGEDLPDSAVLHDYESTNGIPCRLGILGGAETRDWHQVITPSGTFSFVCHVNGN